MPGRCTARGATSSRRTRRSSAWARTSSDGGHAGTPTQSIRFGYGAADEVKRRLLTLWNSARFFLDYAAIEQFEPRYEDLTDGVTGVGSARSTRGCSRAPTS